MLNRKKGITNPILFLLLLSINSTSYAADFSFNVPVNVSNFSFVNAIEVRCGVYQSEITTSDTRIGSGTLRKRLLNGALNETVSINFDATNDNPHLAQYASCSLYLCKTINSPCKSPNYANQTRYKTAPNTPLESNSSSFF